MAKKSSKKRSAAYRLTHKDSGHHYVIRLGREGFDKLKDKKVKRFNPKLQQHVEYELKKIK
jgi:hypothetical protein